MPSSDLECSPSGTHMNNMPWEWTLEYLLEVKELSPLFFKDFIGYFPHLEQPQCSRLVQKLVLRYLDEVAVTRELDTCDALLVRCFLKEQGVSNLHSDIHSLKESFAHDLTLRVETEAVLTNLRSYCEGRRDDLAAYKDAVDKVFSEDILEPRGVERRNELTAVLPDRSNGESEKDLREQLLGKYSLEELYRDLGQFVDDKKKRFKFKFLDQLANDVENGVYGFSPGSDIPETQTPSKMHTDFCDKFQFQDSLSTGKERSVRKTSDHRSSDWPSISRHLREGGLSCKAEDGDSDPPNDMSGVNVSEPNDGKAEISSRMAEVANGLTNGMCELVNGMANVTEFVAADIPFSTPNLRNQQTPSLSVPVAGNPVSMQETFIVVSPAKRGNVDLEIDEPVKESRENIESTEHYRIESLKHCREGDDLSQHTSARIGPTFSRVSPDKLAKRSAVEILDQVPGVAKKRKFNVDEKLSEEKGNQSGATGENTGIQLRHVVQEHLEEGPSNARLSTDNDEDLTLTRVGEICDVIYKDVGKSCSKRASKHSQTSHNEAKSTSGKLNPPAFGGDGELHTQCYFRGNSEDRQAVCHRCFVSTHESYISRVCTGLEENFCLACAATMAQEVLRKAEDDEKKAKEAVRKAKEQVLAIQTNLAVSLSARREASREQPKADNVSVEFNQEAFRGKVTETTAKQSLHAKQGPPEDFLSDPEEEDRVILVKNLTFTATRGPSSFSKMQNFMEDDAISRIHKTSQMQTVCQAAVLSEGLCATRGNDVPGPDFTREANVEEGPTLAPSLPVAQALEPIVNNTSKYCDNEHSGSSGSSKGGVRPISNSSPMKSRTHDGVSEDVRATRRSEVSMSHRGDSIRSSGPLSIRRIPEGEEGDGHDGDLEEVCERSVAAAQRTNVAEKAAGLVSKRLTEASNVEAESRRPQVYRGRSKIPGVRRQSLPWTGIEEDVLKEGVSMFSINGEWGFQWRRILDYGAGKFHQSRTTVDLKDKWRNMHKGPSK